MRSTQYVDVLPLVADLTRLHDLTAVPPTEAALPRVQVFCNDVVARLAKAATLDAPPSDGATWLATRTPETAMVVGPGLFLLVSAEDSTVSLVSEGASWTFGPDPSGSQVSFADDATLRTWTLLREGGVIDVNDTEALEQRAEKSAPKVPWRPTHRVGTHPLPVGAVAVGTLEPGTALDAGLPLRLLDASASGWAFVECADGWQCYVAASGILPIDGAGNG